MTGTHRSHGHPIGKGAKLDRLMAELFGKETGICKGRGGSMHLADNSVGIIGESAIVGGGIPLATGCGLSAKVRGTDQVALCFFGDGAVNQGTFHESLNLAAIWKLPAIYVCENNQYAESLPVKRAFAVEDIAKRAEGYGMPGMHVDGRDVRAVHAAAGEAITRARAGKGPTFIVADSYRHEGHYYGDPRKYQTKDEIEGWRKQFDPIVDARAWIVADKLAAADDLDGIDREIAAEIDRAVAWAEQGPLASPIKLPEDVYAGD